MSRDFVAEINKSIAMRILRELAEAVGVLSLVATTMCGCNVLDDGKQGELRICFFDESYGLTKASTSIPDTNDFILDVRDANGKVIYNGEFGKSPESLLVNAGSYTITAISEEFTKPQFSAPQYGDSQVVVVPSGKTVNVRLDCKMMNAGIKLNIASNFLTSYTDGVLFLKSDDGRLMYSYSEKRIAYFKPGNVSLILHTGSSDKSLFTRSLKAQEVLTIGISAPSGGSSASGGTSSISVKVDTAKVWHYDHFIIGGSNSGLGGGSGSGGSTGEDLTKALSVSQSMASVGEEGVWVYGYIVGGDLTTSTNGISYKKPFKSNTHFALAARASVSSKSSCIAVQLSQEVRDEINLVDHPDLLGNRIYLKGDIVDKYYGLVGFKNVTEYVLK